MTEILKAKVSLTGLASLILLGVLATVLHSAEAIAEPASAIALGKAIQDQSSEIRRRVNDYLDAERTRVDSDYADKGAFSGAVLVARDGQIIVSRGFGYANREWGILAAEDTKFRVWSVTKIFTATTIMQLQEQGKLAIDDPVGKYLPRWPRHWKAVTVRRLLSHTSGLPDFTTTGWKWNPAIAPRAFRFGVSPAESLERDRHRALLFEPGTRFAYNNFGYLVAGLIIEKVTGQPYEEVLRERIFAPLGMKDTGLDRRETILPRRASYYLNNDSRAAPGKPTLVNDYYFDMPSYMFSAGALYSTVTDLLKFDQALYAGSLLRPETLASMWKPVTVPFAYPDGSLSKESQYGLGWETHTVSGRRCFSHPGAGGAAGSFFMHFPDDRVTIVILSNSLGMGAVYTQLPDVVFGNSSGKLGRAGFAADRR